MNDEERAVQILCTALKLEQHAYNFYSRAAHRSTNPEGKKIFIKLADQEKQHVKKLEKKYKQFVATCKCPIENVRPEVLVEEAIVDASLSDIEIFELALQDEENAYQYYVKSAEITKDEASREILLDLAKDEIEHRQMIKKEMLKQ